MQTQSNYALSTRGIWIISSILLLLHSWYYYPFFSDDAFISLRYADRLLNGDGLTWTDGEKVEGYSNLLWVLSTAALGLLKINLVAAGRIVCATGSILSLLAVLLYCEHHHPKKILPKLVGVGILISSGSFAVWTLGGLEATWHACLICWCVFLLTENDFLSSKKKIYGVAFLLGLLAINRPDGILLTGPAIAACLILGKSITKPYWKAILPISLVPIGFAALQTGGRVLYYQELLPNTFHAKFALTSHRFETAWNYLAQGGAAHIWLVVPIALGILALVWRKGTQILNKNSAGLSEDEIQSCRRLSIALLFTITWCAIVFLGGGDIFPGWRHLVPALPVAAIALSELCASWQEKNRILRPEIGILAATLIAGNLWNHAHNKENNRAKHETYAWIGKVTGEFLNQAWGQSKNRPLVAVTSAGAVSFYSKLPTLDMHGLNDRNLTKNKSEKFGKGTQAHELINLDYVFSRKPDIIISHVGGAVPEFGMINIPEFRENYQLVRFPFSPEGNKIEKGFRSHAWIRKEKIPEMLAEAPQVQLKEWGYWEKENQ